MNGMQNNPDSKVHEANIGHIWGRQDPGGPHVGPMNLAIREVTGICTEPYFNLLYSLWSTNAININ